ncbi:MAG TPA: sulfur carrier protein ThiS [Burkholderiaceae bacterium]|nr:sulfur carrier protein ThiS [Burkholderiaceae bacterium]
MSDPTIRVNDDSWPWHAGDHIADVLQRLGVAPSDVTTALNGEFVPRGLRTTTPVQPGDVLTVFKPIVGG